MNCQLSETRARANTRETWSRFAKLFVPETEGGGISYRVVAQRQLAAVDRDVW